MDRRSFLASIATGAALAGTASTLLAPVLAAPPAEPIGDLLDELPADPMARVRAAVAELKAAITALEPSLTEWVLTGVDDLGKADRVAKPSFGLLAWSKAPPVAFSGPGVYEVLFRLNGRTVFPVLWVEQCPRKPGFYRMRRYWQGTPLGDWRRLAASEMHFVRRITDLEAIERRKPGGRA